MWTSYSEFDAVQHNQAWDFIMLSGWGRIINNKCQQRRNKTNTIWRSRILDWDCLVTMCSSALYLSIFLSFSSSLLSGCVVHPGCGVQTVARGKRSQLFLCQHNSISLSPLHTSMLTVYNPISLLLLWVPIICNWLTLRISAHWSALC